MLATRGRRILQVCPLLLKHQRGYVGVQRPNTVLVFVPHQEVWIVERFGKYFKSLEPGLSILIPVVDRIRYVQSLKENAIDIPAQAAITSDNVTLKLDGVLYVRVTDPYKASYGVEDVEFAITQLAQTTMRSEIGKISLDTVFRERESLNEAIVATLNNAADVWGLTCLRYEIRDMILPERIQTAMQMQVEAERKKRAKILESEGTKEAEVNVAEGVRKSTILKSEATKIRQINEARGEAEAILAKARAKAQSIDIVSKALSRPNGSNAVTYSVAEQYVAAFGNLAKKGNSIIVPSNASNVSNMVSQAMTIYKTLSKEEVVSDVDTEQTEDSDIYNLSTNQSNGNQLEDELLFSKEPEFDLTEVGVKDEDETLNKKEDK